MNTRDYKVERGQSLIVQIHAPVAMNVTFDPRENANSQRGTSVRTFSANAITRLHPDRFAIANDFEWSVTAMYS
jgi:hypothetical protein